MDSGSYVHDATMGRSARALFTHIPNNPSQYTAQSIEIHYIRCPFMAYLLARFTIFDFKGILCFSLNQQADPVFVKALHPLATAHRPKGHVDGKKSPIQTLRTLMPNRGKYANRLTTMWSQLKYFRQNWQCAIK